VVRRFKKWRRTYRPIKYASGETPARLLGENRAEGRCQLGEDAEATVQNPIGDASLRGNRGRLRPGKATEFVLPGHGAAYHG